MGLPDVMLKEVSGSRAMSLRRMLVVVRRLCHKDTKCERGIMTSAKVA